MVKNLKKILSILCVVLMTATVFSAVVTNVLADENNGEEKTFVSLNPCVATNGNIHIVWQENLTGNYEIYVVNDAQHNYEVTLTEAIEELSVFDDKDSQKALENLNDALNDCLEQDYKHSIDNVHAAVKNLEKAENTELINTLVDAVRDFAKANILYAEDYLTFNNSYIQEAYNKYYLAIEKYNNGNYDAAIKQFKNSYLKLLEAYEENDETYVGVDFGKMVRISYTDYDSVNPQIFLNGTINVCWEEIIGDETHVYFARSSNNGITWWYFDATEYAYTYLYYAGINPDLLSRENKLLITKTLERILIIDRCHYFYVPIIRDGFGIKDRRVYSPIDDPYLAVHEYKEPIHIGDKKIHIICGGGGGGGDPVKAPDLIVTDIFFSNDQPIEGETNTIYATVENVGTASVSGLSNSIINRFSVGSTTSDAGFTSLTTGGTMTLSADWVALPGNQKITVSTDFTNIVSEGVEGNNILEKLLYVRYIWMNLGNYFDFETLQQNETTTQSFQYDAKILDISPDKVMKINETYSQDNVTISFISIVDLKTRKHLRTGSSSYSSWLWLNNNDVNGGSIQLADKTFSLIGTTADYYMFYYSEPSGNESTLYYSKSNNMLAKTEDTLIINGDTINSATDYTASGNAPLATKSTPTTETTSDTTTATTTTAKSGSTILFSDNFDDGNADGWTVSGGHNGMPYWHVTSYRKYSGSYSLVFNDEKSHNYINRSSGASRSYGSAEFSVDLSSVSTATLEYYDWYEVEDLGYDNYDCMYVKISTDGGSTWTELRERDCGDGNQKTWTKQTIGISSYTGQVVKIRFYFDSRDEWYNNYEGWYIDDVVVTSIDVSTVLTSDGTHSDTGSKFNGDGTYITDGDILSCDVVGQSDYYYNDNDYIIFDSGSVTVTEIRLDYLIYKDRTADLDIRLEWSNTGGTTWTTISTITHPVDTTVSNNPTSYVWSFAAKNGLFKAVYAPGSIDLYYGTITYIEITWSGESCEYSFVPPYCSDGDWNYTSGWGSSKEEADSDASASAGTEYNKAGVYVEEGVGRGIAQASATLLGPQNGYFTPTSSGKYKVTMVFSLKGRAVTESGISWFLGSGTAVGKITLTNKIYESATGDCVKSKEKDIYSWTSISMYNHNKEWDDTSYNMTFSVELSAGKSYYFTSELYTEQKAGVVGKATHASSCSILTATLSSVVIAG